MVALPKIEINGIDLVKWEAEPPIRANGYDKIKELPYVRTLVAVVALLFLHMPLLSFATPAVVAA